MNIISLSPRIHIRI